MTGRTSWKARVRRTASIWVALVPLACGSGTSTAQSVSDAAKSDARVSADATTHACTPGKQGSCPCPGSTTTGVQVCSTDGESFGSCTGCAVHDATTDDDARTGSDATSSKDGSSTKDTGSTKGDGGRDAGADVGESLADGGHDGGHDTGATEICSPACTLGEVCGAGGPGRCGSIYCATTVDAAAFPNVMDRCVGGVIHLCQNPSDPNNPDPGPEPCPVIPVDPFDAGLLVCCSNSADAGVDAGHDAGLLTACPDAGGLGACGELANDAGSCGSCLSGASLSCGAAGPNRCGSSACQAVAKVAGQCENGQAHLCSPGDQYLTIELGQGCTIIPVDAPGDNGEYVCCPD